MKRLLSALCILFSIVALGVYFMRIAQITAITDFTGLLLFVPTLLAIPGLIFAWPGKNEPKHPATVVLILLNALFLLSLPLIHFVGTLLLGV